MKILAQTLNIKRGEVAIATWLIEQVRPFPCIRSTCGSLEWSHFDGIYGHHGRPAEGLGNSYRAMLLAPGINPPKDWNRTHLAGYEGNGGTFSIRGRDMGEISIEYGFGEFDHRVRVRGFEKPTPGEYEFLKSKVIPGIKSYTKTFAEDLREYARNAVIERMQLCCDGAIQEIEELRSKIKEAKF